MKEELLEKIKREVPADDSAADEEKELLYALIRSLKPNVVVETGTHRGMATLYMAQALKDNGKGHITTYDPFDWGQIGNFGKFPELNERITFKQKPGKEMDETEIDFAFIDGFHGFIDVIEEIKALYPRLAKRAVVVFHDCWYEEPGVSNGTGVNQAVEAAGLQTVWLPTKNALRIFSKHEENPTG